MKREGSHPIVKYVFAPAACAALLCLGLVMLFNWETQPTSAAGERPVAQERCPSTPEPKVIIQTVVATSPAVVVTRQVIVEVTRTVEQTVMATVIHTSTPDAKVVEEYQSMHEELDALDLKLEQDKRDLEFAQAERNASLKFGFSVALAVAVLLFATYTLIILARMLRNHPAVVDAIDNAKEWYEEEQEPDTFEPDEIIVVETSGKSYQRPRGEPPTLDEILEFYEAAVKANSMAQKKVCAELRWGVTAWQKMRDWLAHNGDIFISNGEPRLWRGTIKDLRDRYKKAVSVASTAPPP